MQATGVDTVTMAVAPVAQASTRTAQIRVRAQEEFDMLCNKCALH